MERVLVTCRGLPPGMLMNPATEELLDQILGRVPAPRRKDWSPEEEAATKLFFGDNYGAEGQIGIPSVNLFSCLVKAGRMVQFKGRQNISTATSTLLPSFLAILDEFLPLKNDPQWVVDKRRGTNPNGGQMVCLIRPKFKDWEFDVNIEIDEKRLNENRVRELFDMAGTAMGLGDFRPGKGGMFGRFAVTNWVRLDGSSNGKAEVGASELSSVVV